MVEVIEVSNSKIELWDKCRYAYYLRYGERLQRVTPAKPQFKGNWIHKILEEEAHGRRWRKVHKQYTERFNNFLFADEFKEDPDLPLKIRVLMEAYFQYYKNSSYVTIPFPDRTKAEWAFRELIGPKIYLRGIIDRIVRDTNGRKWVLDHKATGNIPSEGVHDFDLQNIIYTRVLTNLGIPVRGMIWDYIRFNPTMPTLTQAGALSEKKIDTLPGLYDYLALQHGVEIPEKVRDRLVGIEAKFFQRHKLRTKSSTANTILQDVVTKAKDIRKNGCKVRTRTLGRHCSWCEYRKICLVRLHRLDDSRLIGSEYVRKDSDTSTERFGLRAGLSGNGTGRKLRRRRSKAA